MRKYLNPLLVVMVIVVLLLIGVDKYRSSPAATPGCATPNELLTRASAAYDAGNRDELALCQSAYIRFNPDTGKAMADITLMSRQSEQVVIDGVKKYDALPFIYALGFPGMSLIYMGKPPFDLLLKSGKLAITGNTAIYTYTVSKKGDEILPTQPELLKYTKAMMGNSTTVSRELHLEKINDRWFLASPDLKEASAAMKVNTAMRQYVEQVRKSIPTCADAKSLTAALAEPNKKLKQVMTDAVTAK